MYLAETSQSNTDKIVAALVTTFFLCGMFVVLRMTSLPAVKQKTENYEEIDWAKFKPKPEKIVETPMPPEPIKTEKPKIIEALPRSVPKPAVRRVDLSTLQNMALEDIQKSQPLQRSAAKKEGAEHSKIDLKKSSLSAGMNTLLGESSTKLDLPKSGRRGRKLSSTRITAGSGQSVGQNKGLAAASGGLSLGAPEAKDVGGGNVDIRMIDMGDLGGDFSDLSPIYHELIAWMKRNPGRFPVVVKRFMEAVPGDLMATVNFYVDGRNFQMFLLCKEKLFEVRVCLLEEKELTYLIDRGLKENSSFLRIGSVNRAPTGKILSFGTVRKEASNSRTVGFYQVFFSWWESVKMGN